MNLTEALKTGKMLRRPRHGGWISHSYAIGFLTGEPDVWYWEKEKSQHTIVAADLLATDWEAKDVT